MSQCIEDSEFLQEILNYVYEPKIGLLTSSSNHLLLFVFVVVCLVFSILQSYNNIIALPERGLLISADVFAQHCKFN